MLKSGVDLYTRHIFEKERRYNTERSKQGEGNAIKTERITQRKQKQKNSREERETGKYREGKTG